MRRQLTTLLLACLMQPAIAATLSSADPAASGSIHAVADFGKLPLAFEANQGQADATIRFLSHGAGYGISFTETETVLSIIGKGSAVAAPQAATVRMRLAGARPRPEVSGVDPLPGISNYFIGNDPARWQRNVPQYAKVRYGQVYPGIDLLYYGNQRQIEYDFVVAPKADARRIALIFAGVKKLSLDEAGNLVLATTAGDLVQHKPIAYQEIDGQRQPVDSRYVLRGKHRVGFQLARYDHSRPLVIDPVLAFAACFSGASGSAVAVDKDGYVYVTGQAEGALATPGAYSPHNGYNWGPFIAKLTPGGNALVYLSIFGQSNPQSGAAIAVDDNGNAYITGTTNDVDFPTTPGAYQTAFGGGYDAFVLKLNPQGNALVYSTFLGGPGYEYGAGISVDSSGNVYVAGDTTGGFPSTRGAFQTVLVGSSGAFVTKLNPSGSGLVYSTYLNSAIAGGIAIDHEGNAYITGMGGRDLVTPGAYQTATTGGTDAFVAKLNAAGSALIYGTLLGGSGDDQGSAIAVDSSGSAYVTGYTSRASSNDFPTTPGAFQTSSPFPAPCGPIACFDPADAFVSKLSPDGSKLVYSTYLGGGVAAIAIDTAGNAYVTGSVLAVGDWTFPTTPGAIQPTSGGQLDAFLIKLNASGSALLYSTYLGGSGNDQAHGIAVDRSGNVYVTGQTDGEFPTTPGALQTTDGGLFVAKFSPSVGSEICPNGGLWAVTEEINGLPGRGFSIEDQGSVLVLTVYAYEASGRATFYQASGTLNGGSFVGALNTYAGGTTFGGPLQSATVSGQARPVTIQFSDSASGTITFPGETAKAIKKFNWSTGPSAGVAPAAGLWAVTAELNGQPGRGFTIEEQGGVLTLTVYAYDAAGLATFYQAVGSLDKGTFSSTLTAYAGGTAFGGPAKSAKIAGQAGPVTMSFADAAHGSITLPGELPKAISKFQWGSACQ